MILGIAFFGLGEMCNTNIARSMFDWLDWGAPIFILISLVFIFSSVKIFNADQKVIRSS